jgi:hypothetical protein
MIDPKRDLLRHAVATIAYRGGKVVRGLTQEQAEIRACEGEGVLSRFSRTSVTCSRG